MPAALTRGMLPGEDVRFLSAASVTALVSLLTAFRGLLEAPHSPSPTPRCLCLDGFEGDGFSCTPSNPCSRPDRGGCSENVSLALSLKS